MEFLLFVSPIIFFSCGSVGFFALIIAHCEHADGYPNFRYAGEVALVFLCVALAALCMFFWSLEQLNG